MCESEKVSIIVPIYNVEKFLKRCLLSLYHQTYENIEIIMVNDGSPDCSDHICKEFCDKDSRFKYIEQKNQGLSAARNTGIRASSGTYLVFVDSDDFVDENMISDYMKIVRKYNPDMIISGYYADIYLDDKLQQSIPYSYSKSYLKGKAQIIPATIKMKKNTLIDASWNKMYKKSILTENQIWMPEGKLYEDIDFMYHLLYYINSIYVTPKCYYHYIQHSGLRITKSYRENKFDILKERISTMNQFYETYKQYMSQQDWADLSFWMIRYSYSCIMDLFLPDCKKTGREKREFVNKVVKDPLLKQSAEKCQKVDGQVHRILVFLIRLGKVHLIYYFSYFLFLIRSKFQRLFFKIKKRGV